MNELPDGMLLSQVVEHSRSVNYCNHFNIGAEQCAAERTVGLIAQQACLVQCHVVAMYANEWSGS